jgi:hypothetical protein
MAVRTLVLLVHPRPQTGRIENPAEPRHGLEAFIAPGIRWFHVMSSSLPFSRSKEAFANGRKGVNDKITLENHAFKYI